MTSIKEIVVGYDGSTEAGEALEWAAKTAALEGRAVRAVRVLDQPRPGRPAPREPDGAVRAQVQAVLTAEGVGGAFEPHAGNVRSVLVDQSADAHMLVVGSSGHRSMAGTVLGSLSDQVARHARCPVVVVSRRTSPDAAHILVGLDGSPESMAALDFACRRAVHSKEAVVALHAWKPGHVQLNHNGQLPDALADRAETAEAALATYVAHVHSQYPGVEVETESVAITPGEALADASVHASLVVTGLRQRGPLSGLLHSSVSDHLLHHARCPLAMVPSLSTAS